LLNEFRIGELMNEGTLHGIPLAGTILVGGRARQLCFYGAPVFVILWRVELDGEDAFLDLRVVSLVRFWPRLHHSQVLMITQVVHAFSFFHQA